SSVTDDRKIAGSKMTVEVGDLLEHIKGRLKSGAGQAQADEGLSRPSKQVRQSATAEDGAPARRLGQPGQVEQSETASTPRDADRYTRRVIVQQGDDAVTAQAAKKLAAKHPENTVLVKADKQENLIGLDQVPAGRGPVKVQMVGHSDVEGGKLDDADGPALARQIGQVKARLGDDAVVEKVALVGCQTACAPEAGQSLTAQVEAELAKQGTAVGQVKGRDTYVKVDQEGSKQDADTNDQQALPKRRLGYEERSAKIAAGTKETQARLEELRNTLPNTHQKVLDGVASANSQHLPREYAKRIANLEQGNAEMDARIAELMRNEPVMSSQGTGREPSNGTPETSQRQPSNQLGQPIANDAPLIAGNIVAVRAGQNDGTAGRVAGDSLNIALGDTRQAWPADTNIPLVFDWDDLEPLGDPDSGRLSPSDLIEGNIAAVRPGQNDTAARASGGSLNSTGALPKDKQRLLPSYDDHMRGRNEPVMSSQGTGREPSNGAPETSQRQPSNQLGQPIANDAPLIAGNIVAVRAGQNDGTAGRVAGDSLNIALGDTRQA
ncbi:hypothetical protein J2785_007498, partial [Burkholderia ambifaria]